MIYRKDEIKNTVKEIKSLLANDPIYQPIIKKLGIFVRETQTFDEFINHQYDINRTTFEAVIKNNDRAYLNYVETTKKEVEAIKKNQQEEIDFNLVNYREALKKLLVKHREALRLIDDKAEDANIAKDETIKQAELAMSRKLAISDKEIEKTKAIYQKEIIELENEKEATLTRLIKNYDENRKKLNIEHKNYAENNHQVAITIQNEHEQNIKINDDNYLLIKQNFNEVSVHLNKKINELKKIHQKAYQQIEKKTEKLLKPVLEHMDLQKANYEQAKIDAKNEFQNQLIEQNTSFDTQKEHYEQRKEKILHRTNETITLLNSKLSAFREANHKDKLETSKIYQQKISESLTETEKDQLSKARTKKYKQYDLELNKQIIRTSKTILQKQKEHQRLMTSNDQKHLEEVNEWRLKKSLIEYEQKQNHIKIDLNYNYNHTILDMQKKLIEADDLYLKEAIQIQLSKSLTHLEAQLQIASSIQERDLNMLANDAHFEISKHKHALNENQYLLELETSKYKHDLEILNALYKADQHILNVTTQLNLEKEKLKRDSQLDEKVLRDDLETALFKRKMFTIEYDLKQETALLEMDRELINHLHHFEHESLKMAMQKETRMRQYEIKRAQLKADKNLSNEKAYRLLKLDQIELEYNQQQIERFIAILRHDYFFRLRIQDLLIETYLLPAHPETFKQFIHFLIVLTEIFENHQIKQLEYAHDEDKKLYVKKIQDFTHYKYTLKHEDTISYYDQQLKKINEHKNKFIQHTKALEQEIISRQQTLESHQNQLQKLLSVNQSDDYNSNNKEFQKLKLNHDQEIKKHNQEINQLDREINNIHRKILPLNESLEKLEISKQNALNHLEIDKQKETANLQHYLAKNQFLYQQFAKLIKNQSKNVISIFTRLMNELYVSDMTLEELMSELYQTETKYGNELINYQQKFLSLMFAFYKESELEHQNIINRFDKSNQHLLDVLETSNRQTQKQESIDDQRRMTNKQKGIFEIKNQLKKRLDLLHLTYEKDMSALQTKIQSLESNIQTNHQKLQNELGSLASNQTSIATQFAQDYEKQTKELSSAYKKESQLHAKKHQELVIQHESLRQSIEAKNNVLYQRYQSQREKIISNLNQKLISQTNYAQKNKETNKTKHKQFEQNQKRLKLRLENEQLHMNKHHKRYLNETTKSQQSMLRKEIGMLKKAHHFKMKMLKLN
jgi:golgin subfamily A member 4